MNLFLQLVGSLRSIVDVDGVRIYHFISLYYKPVILKLIIIPQQETFCYTKVCSFFCISVWVLVFSRARVCSWVLR